MSMKYTKNTAFIAMQFKDMDNIHQVLKEACKNNNIKDRRVDELTNSNPILKDIVKLIEDSEFLVFDLTFANPNVYYELGFAHASGNKGRDILLIAKKDTNLLFDISHRRVLFYNDEKDLQEQLKIKLPQFIEDGRKNEK